MQHYLPNVSIELRLNTHKFFNKISPKTGQNASPI